MTLLLFVTWALVAIASFAPDARLWGVNHLAFYPLAVRCAILIALAVAMVPAVADRVLQNGRRLAALASAHRRVAAAGAATVCLALGLAFHPATHLLGDQNFIAAIARGAATATETEFRESLRHPHHVFPGTDLLYSIIGRYSVRVLHVGAEASIRILVSAIGAMLAYVWTLWALRRSRAPQGQPMLLPLLLATSGAVALFCGYIEVYAPLLGALVLYVVVARRALEGRASLWAPAACLALAAFLHTMALVLLPSLAWLVIAARRRDHSRLLTRMAIGTCVAMVPLTGLLRFVPGVAAYLRPLFGEPTAALGSIHVADMANVLLLSCPVMGVVVGGLLRARAASRECDATPPDARSASFAWLVATPLFLFLVAFRSDLGVARDWDLFMPAGVATVWALLEARPGCVVLPGRSVASVTVLCAALAGAWIGINASAERSVARYRAIVSYDLPQMKDPAYAWEQLAAYYRERNNTPEEIVMLEHAVATSQNPRYRITLGTRYYARGDRDRAIELFGQALRSDPSNGRVREALVEMLLLSRRFDELILQCDEGMRREPGNPFYPYYKGRALAASRRTAESMEALKQASRLNPTPQMAKQIDSLIRWLEEQP
ncbi:MAG TPA: tetratricopeptide repeat protein [Candidatus Krumholzibacteria bacterium]